MRKITYFFYSCHRILGTLLSILFLVWFLSGMVMIFHTFPRVSQQDRLSKKDYLPTDMPALSQIIAQMPSSQLITAISVENYQGKPVFRICADKKEYAITADGLPLPEANTSDQIRLTASLWCDQPVLKVDTLYTLDQWIPFGQLKKDLPVYKFIFDDAAKHQLHISSVSGDVLQFTDRNSRFWAWMGAIPHWIYFTRLRQDLTLWKDTVIWLSGIGSIMCLLGIGLGAHRWIQARRRHRNISPYKKSLYKWHHLTGLIFGSFAFTFVFSGMMSLAAVPQWISKPSTQNTVARIWQNSESDRTGYPLDYRVLLTEYPKKIKQIRWENFNEKPCYVLSFDSATVFIDASRNIPVPLNLNESEIIAAIRGIHGEAKINKSELLTDFDTYYVSRKNRLDLPVWKVSVADADNSCYYINPKNGQFRYINDTSRWRHWMYPALHSFSIDGIVQYGWLWNLLMWSSLIGGTILSLTGVFLGLKYIKRILVKSRRE